MRGNFQTASNSSTKYFLVDLARVYDKICDSLDKIATSQKINKNRISKLIEKSVVTNSLDRRVRIENQVKLFQETFTVVQAFLNKRSSVKKSDVAINFSMVSEIIVKRLSQQLVLEEAKKGELLETIERNKQQYLEFFEGNQKRKKRENQPEYSQKITDQYVLKYAFTEFTRPTTAAISRVQSSVQTPEQRGTYRPQTNKNLPDNNENSTARKNKDRRRVTDISLLGTHDSKAYRYNKANCSTEITKKINNFTLTQSQSSIILQNMQSREKQKHLQFSGSKNFVNYQKTQKIFEKNQQEKQMLASMESQVAEDKKSLYYQSQNYLKSRKNIETVSLLSHKKKHKLSAYMQKNEQIQEDGQQYNLNFKEGNLFKTGKIITRKEIPEEDAHANLIKSEKSIPRCSTIGGLQGNQNAKAKQSLCKVSKLSKMKQNMQLPKKLRSFMRLQEKSLTYPYQGYNLGEVGLEATSQLKEYKSNPEGKSFAEIYAELSGIRSDIIHKTDYQFRSFSNFFHQQVLLQQEENRRIQKILKQSRNYCYIQQFEMIKQVKKPQKRLQEYREQAFIAGIRGHMKACNVLGQIGPTNNEF